MTAPGLTVHEAVAHDANAPGTLCKPGKAQLFQAFFIRIMDRLIVLSCAALKRVRIRGSKNTQQGVRKEIVGGCMLFFGLKALLTTAGHFSEWPYSFPVAETLLYPQ